MALSDRKLFRLGRQYKEAQAEETAAKAAKETIRDKVVPELNRRGVKALEGEGVRINKTDPEETVYNVDKAADTLDDEVFDYITEVKIVPARVSECLADGRIKPKQLRKFAKVHPKASYITVSFTDG